MKNRIEEMIELLKYGRYDNEGAHSNYDRLLEDYIKEESHDAETRALILQVIELEKDFWYA